MYPKLTITFAIFLASVATVFAQSQNVRSLNFNNDDPSAATRKSITIKAPSAINLSADQTWILPGTLPLANQFLSVSSITGSTATLGWTTVTAGTAGWGLMGNSATIAGTNFIGTTDAQDLVFKTGGIENFRINQKGRMIASSTFPAAGANSLYIGAAGNDTQLAGAVKNTAIGYQTLTALTSGSENTAIGNQALNAVKDGIENTAIGVLSLNKSVGNLQNTAIGYKSLTNTTGDGNTAVGGEAGANLTTGSSNTAIGNATNFASSTASNQLNIANNIFGTGLSGSVTTPAGKIGIGTATPDNTLHVKGTNPLKLEGLQTGTASDKVLTVDANGVVRQQVNTSAFPAVFISASYTVAATDYYVIVKPTANAIVDITLPPAGDFNGRVISISNFANPNPTTVNIKSTSFAQLKIGYGALQSSVVLTANNSTTSIASGAGQSTWISDGVNWYQIGL